MKKEIQDIFDTWVREKTEDFSGVLSASGSDGVIAEQAFGFRNVAEELPNTVDTAFAIASGTKLFTGLAVCKLIDSGKLSLDALLCDVLSYDLGQIDKSVTVFQLLTHTSGVGDYIDEEADDEEEQLQNLYNKYPVQLWTLLEYYLQMITPLASKFKPGERFGYSNSGYILLGLVVEAVSGLPFQQFVYDEIIKPCGLTRTGFYRMDSLPANTALGYMHDKDTGKWHTNIYSLPILGGSDGGIYSCAADFDKLWRAIFANKILSDDMTKCFLKSHAEIEIDEEDGTIVSYGLGVYNMQDGDKAIYFAVGADSGVGFFTGYYPATKTVVSSFCNNGYNGSSLLFGDSLKLLG